MQIGARYLSPLKQHRSVPKPPVLKPPVTATKVMTRKANVSPVLLIQACFKHEYIEAGITRN